MTTAEARAQVWDPAGFRSRLQAVLDVFLAEQGERLAPLGPDALRLHQEACRAVSGGKRFRAAFCYWGFRAVRPTDPEPVHEDWLLRACAALEILHASALAHDDFMDASDTRRGHPSTHRAFEAEHRDARLGRGPGAVRRGRGHPARRPAAVVGRRAAPPVRLPADPGRARARPLRPVPLRGDHRPVPRRLGAGARCRRRRRRDAGAALQVREVLRRATAAHRRRPRRGHAGGPRRPDRGRAAARRGLPAPRRPARRLRRPVRHREARRGRPRGGQAHGARGPGARRSRARGRRAARPRPRDAARRRRGDPAARDHRRVRRARPGRGRHRRARRPRARGARTGPGSTTAPAPSCARWRPPTTDRAV